MSTSQIIDISGKRFGSLTVSDQRKLKGKNSYWLCSCDCGKSVWVRLNSLINGLTNTCGHGSSRTWGTNENGKTFGLLSLSNRRYDGRNVIYNYHCRCGNNGIVSWKHVKDGSTASCGCSKQSRLGNNAAGKVWYSYIKNAKVRNLKFKLSESEFLNLICLPCHYCGSQKKARTKGQCKTGDFNYTGIDRMDSSKGYTVNNCVPCCTKCNRVKMSMPMKEFAEWIRSVYWHFYVGKMGVGPN